jgi:glycosyltransferase involved in cell wall biosynthesis
MESTIGGTRRHITDTAKGLAGRGLDVHIVVSAERQPEFREDFARLEAAGVTVHELAMERAIRPGLDARHVVALRRLIRWLRPEIVHTHSSKAGVLGRVAARMAGPAHRVHTPHTMAFLFEDMFSARKRRLFRGIEARLARITERVIAVSESEAATFVESGVVPAEKVRVVANGVDPQPFLDARPVDLGSLGLDPTRVTWAVVGLLNVAKGHELALEALASAGNESAQLLFAGHGALQGELEARSAALGVADRVAFLGFRRDVPALLAAVDGLLLPSRWEGMPYIVLEAMAAGLPIVATPVNGAVDLVVAGRTGWLASEVSAAALARELRAAQLAGASVRASFGAAGRERLLERYCVEHMIDGLLSVYAELP